MRKVLLLEAKCASCGHVFGRPTLSDFDYGEAVLCTTDGKHYATANAFSDLAERVSTLVKLGESIPFWPTLASLADSISGQTLTTSRLCPQCNSDNLEYWGGKDMGVVTLPQATFTVASALSSDMLARRIGVTLPGEHEA